MTEPDSATRIEAALARIERAAADRARDRQQLIDRHAQLRARVAEAIAAIDDLAPGGPAPTAQAAH